MKQISFAQIVVLALVSFATQAVAQTSISADGMIESTTGGFKFPDGSVQLTAQGACAETCPITASCVDGECKCPGAQVLCDGSCIDVLSDELNCGSCGHSCAGEDSCNNGFCPLEEIASSQGQPYGLALGPSHVYWTNLLTGTANDAPTINPIDPFTIAFGLGTPQDIQVDYTHFYVTEFSSGQVRRKPLVGGGMPMQVLAQGGPFGLALNGTYVYWTTLGGGTIMRTA